MPFGQVDYHAGAATSGHLEKTMFWRWNDTSAPWLRKLAQGDASSPGGLHLWCALRDTAQSQATDPRDKLFGILGLVRADVPQLVPDYSISVFEMCIGISIHMLVELKDPFAFIIAASCPNQAPLPSWVPNWFTPALWDGSLSDGDEAAHSQIAAWDKYKKLNYDTLSWLDKYKELNPMTEDWSDECYSVICARRDTSVRCFKNPDRPITFTLIAATLWHRSISVDASTATLTIRLIHLLELAPRRSIDVRQEDGNLTCFDVSAGKYSPSLHFRTGKISLDDTLKQQSPSLFLLPTSDTDDPLLLIMRKDVSSPGYTLITCVTCYDIYLKGWDKVWSTSSEHWENFLPPLRLRSDLSFDTNLSTVGFYFPKLINLGELKKTFETKYLLKLADGIEELDPHLHVLFWGQKPNLDDALRLFQVFEDEARRPVEKRRWQFWDAYTTFAEKHFKASKKDFGDYSIILTLPPGQFCIDHRMFEYFRGERWEVHCKNGKFYRMDKRLDPKSIVGVNIAWQSIREQIRHTELYRHWFRAFCTFRYTVSESIPRLMMRPVVQEDFDTYAYQIPRVARKYLGLDVTPMDVCIM